jgi:hypothetical protein
VRINELFKKMEATTCHLKNTSYMHDRLEMIPRKQLRPRHPDSMAALPCRKEIREQLEKPRAHYNAPSN